MIKINTTKYRMFEWIWWNIGDPFHILKNWQNLKPFTCPKNTWMLHQPYRRDILHKESSSRKCLCQWINRISWFANNLGNSSFLKYHVFQIVVNLGLSLLVNIWGFWGATMSWCLLAASDWLCYISYVLFSVPFLGESGGYLKLVVFWISISLQTFFLLNLCLCTL